MSAKVMIVDDNEMYRAAFRRNLMLRDYDVCEAENGEEALRIFQEQKPEVVVTDLSMRTPNEGLDVIRAVRGLEPLVPIVMISAVGTFEEGAEASRLGAHSVISKSRIDEEIESLYRTIEAARESSDYNRKLLTEIEAARPEGDGEDGAAGERILTRLREIMTDPKAHQTVRSEAFDLVASLTESDSLAALEERIRETSARDLELAEARLQEELAGFASCEEATRKELLTAEYFYAQQGGDKPEGAADFSRNIGFSYCFAVENEAKNRMRKRIHKFLSQRDTVKLIRKLIDPKTGQLDLFYHQHLARIQQLQPFDFTIDNVRQVFQRILEHESRYKPDGLKALGILILCFARTYEVKTLRGNVLVANPLNLKGFDDQDSVIAFSQLLVALQHFRNPYIHPEISEMEKISKIRETAFDCLNRIVKLN